jgi:hypothetical protein
MIITHTSVEIHDSILSVLPYQQKVTVVTMGGKVGKDKVWVEGEPSFQVGENVFLFLDQLEPNLWRPVGGFQGKFNLEDGNVVQEGVPALPKDFFLDLLTHEVYPEEFGELPLETVIRCKPSLKCEPFKIVSNQPTFYLQENTKDFFYRYISLNYGPAQWDNVPYQYCTYMKVMYGGTPVAKPALDGVNLIVWAPLPKGTVAMTTCYYKGNFIVEADIIFNDNLPWSNSLYPVPGGYDIQAVATHEFGHVLGLQDLYGQECRGQTMFWGVAPGETKKRDLSYADKLGMQWLYPKLRLSFDVAGVSSTDYAKINGHSEYIRVTSGPGYFSRTIEFSEGWQNWYNVTKFCNPNYLIFSSGLGGESELDDIQITNIKLQHFNGKTIFRDSKVYHIGDNTPAQIIELYTANKWYDDNPPEFWKALRGKTLRLPITYPPTGTYIHVPEE